MLLYVLTCVMAAFGLGYCACLLHLRFRWKKSIRYRVITRRLCYNFIQENL